MIPISSLRNKLITKKLLNIERPIVLVCFRNFFHLATISFISNFAPFPHIPSAEDNLILALNMIDRTSGPPHLNP